MSFAEKRISYSVSCGLRPDSLTEMVAILARGCSLNGPLADTPSVSKTEAMIQVG